MSDLDALFNQYVNEYCNKSTDISNKILTTSSLSGELRKRKVLEVEVDIKDADAILKKMDMEARSVAPDRSRILSNKVKEYKADLVSLKEKLNQAKASVSGADAARAELGLSSDYASSSQAQRDRMLTATQRLEESNARLQHGKVLLAATEDMGANVLSNLHSQRETIVRASDRLHDTDADISKARTILSGMARRMMQNKLIMLAIMAVLIVAIVLIIYLKVK